MSHISLGSGPFVRPALVSGREAKRRRACWVWAMAASLKHARSRAALKARRHDCSHSSASQDSVKQYTKTQAKRAKTSMAKRSMCKTTATAAATCGDVSLISCACACACACFSHRQMQALIHASQYVGDRHVEVVSAILECDGIHDVVNGHDEWTR